MSNKPPAYQMYAADFDMDTAAWSNEEVGAYQRLLNHAWLNRGVPNDTWRLANIVRVSIEHFEGRLWPTISSKWIENGHGNLVNPRQEKERAKQEKYRQEQSEAGKRGVEAKKEKGVFPFDQTDNQATLDHKNKQPLISKSSDPSPQNQGSLVEKSSSSSSFSSSSLSTTSKKTNDSPEVPEAPSVPIPVHPSKRMILNYETGKFEGLLPEDFEYLQEHYPACNIEIEFKEFEGYWFGQGTKKKKKNWWTALANRLGSVQQWGGTKGYNPQKPSVKVPGAPAKGLDQRDWDVAEEERKEADRRWRGLDAYDRQPYLDKAQADNRSKLMSVETVAFLIFTECKDADKGDHP